MVKVSILIPVYNSIKYLKQCVDSVLNQTLEDIEIICIDDGSTDGSEIMLDNYASDDARVKVIHKANSGYGASMNIGLDEAKGKYIGVVESDDFIDPKMFEILYDCAEKSGVHVVRAQYFDYTEQEGAMEHTLFDGVPEAEIKQPPYNKIVSTIDFPDILQGYVYLWSSIYDNSFLNTNGIRFNETPGASFQDIGFTYKVNLAVEKMMFISNPLYYYRRDNENSSVYSKNKVYCVCDEFKEIWSYLKEHQSFFEKYKYYIPSAQFRRYGETRGRLCDTERMMFNCKMFCDFDELEDDGVLDPDYWSYDAWDDFNGQKDRFETALVDVNNYNSFIRYLKLHGDVYIYGAGKVCKQVLDIINNQVSIKAIIVSSLDNNPNSLNDIPIINLNKYLEDKKDNDLIIISVKDDDQHRITRRLYINNCNFIQMTRGYRAELS